MKIWLMICWFAAVGTGAGAPLVYAEYVISNGAADNDPGLGNGTEMAIPAIPASAGEASLAVTIPPGALPVGVPGSYLLSVRVKDAEDRWTVLTRGFQVAAEVPEISDENELSHVEAYVVGADVPNDVSAGSGDLLLSPPGEPSVDGVYGKVFSGEVFAALAPGVYRVAVRGRTSGGLWTTPLARTFVVPGATEPQFYYPRWRVRDPLGLVVQSGSFSNVPLGTFPTVYEARLPVGGGVTGVHTLEVALEDFQGAPGELVEETFEVVSHGDFWEAVHFTDPLDRGDPAVSGPGADPNGDGVTNAMAYVLGLDPEESHGWVLRALAGPSGGARAELALPWELPDGGFLRVTGTADLGMPFEMIAEVDAPLEIVTVPAFGALLETGVLRSRPGLYLTPPEGDWDGRGFFRLEVEYDGVWPFEVE